MKKLLLILTITLLSFKGWTQCVINGLNSSYCLSAPVAQMTPGIIGGAFSGPGVTGSSFNPATAGLGVHTITYAATCSSYLMQQGIFAPQPTVGTSVVLGDDQTSAALPIGFTFTFFCNAYTNFYLCSNGFLTFTGGQASPFTTATLPTNVISNFIAFPWTDLHPGLGGTITYTTIGNAPNRVLVVSYNQVAHYNGGNGGFPITVQILLFETTNKIEIHTTSMPIPASLSNATYGIENLGGTAWYVVPGRNNTNNWSATNEMYSFTPPLAPCTVTQAVQVAPAGVTVTASADSICVGESVTLTGNGNSTYTWTSPASNLASITDSPVSTTIYTVAGTNQFNCSSITAKKITVFTSAKSICNRNSNHRLPGRNSNHNCSWSGNIYMACGTKYKYAYGKPGCNYNLRGYRNQCFRMCELV